MRAGGEISISCACEVGEGGKGCAYGLGDIPGVRVCVGGVDDALMR